MLACVDAKPKFVNAVVKLARSERLFAVCRNEVEAASAAVPSPKFERAVLAEARSERLFAANKAPVPEGAAQVPSPRQKVLELAEVPLLRRVTDKLPVTPVLRLIAGMSAATSARKVGLAAEPVEGPTKTALADWVLIDGVKVPIPVTGLPAVELKIVPSPVKLTDVTPEPVADSSCTAAPNGTLMKALKRWPCGTCRVVPPVGATFKVKLPVVLL